MEIEVFPTVSYMYNRTIKVVLRVSEQHGSNMSDEGYAGKYFEIRIERNGFSKAIVNGKIGLQHQAEAYRQLFDAVMAIVSEIVEFPDNHRSAVQCFCDRVVLDIQTLAKIL
ncbi:hypothetical protein [Cronobacter phage vB_Cdu_VP8]|nr:hypothetical protein [Cronobacter phage vB_Cdu_VP8]